MNHTGTSGRCEQAPRAIKYFAFRDRNTRANGRAQKSGTTSFVGIDPGGGGTHKRIRSGLEAETTCSSTLMITLRRNQIRAGSHLVAASRPDLTTVRPVPFRAALLF